MNSPDGMPFSGIMNPTYQPNGYHQSTYPNGNDWLVPDYFSMPARSNSQGTITDRTPTDVLVHDNLTANCINHPNMFESPLYSPAFSAPEDMQFMTGLPLNAMRSNSWDDSARSSTSSLCGDGAEMYFSNDSLPPTPATEYPPSA